MIKKPFFGSIKSRLKYETLSSAPEPLHISPSEKTTFFMNKTPESIAQGPDVLNRLKNAPKKSFLIKAKDTVKKGQKIVLFENGTRHIISPVSGTVSEVRPYVGDYGNIYTAISITGGEVEEVDDTFLSSSKTPDIENFITFMDGVPGNPPVGLFKKDAPGIETIIICGTEKDLFITSNQYALANFREDIEKGLEIIKSVTGVSDIRLAAPPDMKKEAETLNVNTSYIKGTYPAASQKLIVRSVTGKTVPAGKNASSVGVALFSAESVASIGKAYRTGNIPDLKYLTVVKKDHTKIPVMAPIGTPVIKIIESLGETATGEDHIIIGGPMTGYSVYEKEFPVRPDTDAVILQSHENVVQVSDTSCINCGECIRTCPSRVPVNMLVRIVQAGHYEEAADHYDLLSCIECGLCSLVCVSGLPLMQLIKVAKFRLNHQAADKQKKLRESQIKDQTTDPITDQATGQATGADSK